MVKWGRVTLCWWKEEPFQQHSPTLILPGELGDGTEPSSSGLWAVGHD